MKRLTIVWTTDNKITSINMVLKYANNAILKHWWKEINLIIWGASASLVANDEEIQTMLKIAITNGIGVTACRACAESLDVVEQLEALEMDVRYVGEEITQILQSKERVITV